MNSISNIDLSKLKSCDQNWEKMPETERGRICQKCNENIIDFRNKSKADIAKAHVFSQGLVCGLYTKEQLETQNQEISKTKIRQFSGSVYLALLGLISSPLFSQSKQETPQLEQINSNRKQDFKNDNQILKPRSKNDSIIIKGVLSDDNDQPLPFVNVYIEGTQIGTTGNVDGTYKLHIPINSDTLRKFTLVFSAIGYEKKKIQFEATKAMLDKPLFLDLKFNEISVISYGIIIKEPFYLRWWNGLRSVFR